MTSMLPQPGPTSRLFATCIPASPANDLSCCSSCRLAASIAYPFRAYKAELSPRSQALIEDQYAQAARNGEVVVFVRDEARRKLVSFNLPVEDPDDSRLVEGAAPGSDHKPVRKKRPGSSRSRPRRKGVG